MDKPNNYKNHVFENIDLVLIYYCSISKQLNHFFQFCFEVNICTTTIFTFAGLCRYDGHATNFTLNQNLFYLLPFYVYGLSIASFFCPLLSNFFYADLGQNKMKMNE